MESFKNIIVDTIGNGTSILFVVIIVAYAIFKIFENRYIYTQLNNKLKELNENYKNSSIYKEIITMYNEYIDNDLCEINNQTLIEEYISTIYIDGKFIVRFNKNIEKYNKSIKNAGSNCILLGVLGTFVGLLIVLSDIGGTGVSGMNVAFVTSVFGIITSLILNYILLNRFSIEHTILEIMLKLETLMHKKSSYEKNRKINTSVNDIKESIGNISESIKAIERFDEISIRLNDFIQEFDKSINKFNASMDNTETFISNFSKNINKMDEQFKSLNENFIKIFSLYEENQEFNKELMKNTTDTNESIKESMSSIKENIESTTSSQKEVNKDLKDLFDNIQTNCNELFGKMSSTMDSILNKEENFNGNINELNQTLGKYSKQFDDILNNFGQMSSNIKSQSDSMNGEFVKDVKNVIGQFDRYVSMTNKIINNKLNAMSNFITSENSKS